MSDFHRYMFIGAHPDDPDVCGGGTAIQLAKAGHAVKFISATNGDCGHQSMSRHDLAVRRYGETRRAADFIGLTEYQVMDNHDCELMPTLENRWTLIRSIREFKPDVVISHRPCDYHADHRATAQLVTDAAFLVNVPLCCPDVAALLEVPVFGYARDVFRKPEPFQADAVVPLDAVIEEKIELLLKHESQFMEWLPWINGDRTFDKTHLTEAEKHRYLREKGVIVRNRDIADESRKLLQKYYPGENILYAESFAMSEYGRKISSDEFQRLMSAF